MRAHTLMRAVQTKSEPAQSRGGRLSQQLQSAPRQHAQAMQLHALQRAGEEEELQMKHDPLQRVGPEEELPLQGKALQRVGPEDEEPLQGKEGSGGMSAPLRSGIERLSGQDLGAVHVHRNSAEPANVNALAFAQGNDIHLGPGQEQHLPHEAWHVVQQRQGRVQPTVQLAAGVAVNDDPALEAEADRMGAKALSLGSEKV